MNEEVQDEEKAHPLARWSTFLDRHSGLLLGLILLLAFALRLPGLTTWWLNPDEGIYWSVCSWPSWSDFFLDLPTEPHPPLYYTLVRLVLHLGDSLLLLRLPSLLAWLLGIHALYFLTRQLFDKKVALLAALLLASASYAWTSAALIRSYSVWLCFQLYALAFLVQWLQTHSRRSIQVSSIFWCLALATHYFASIFMPTALLLVLLDQRRRSFPRQEVKLLAWCALTVLLLGVLLFQFHFRAALLENAGQKAAQHRALNEAFGGGVSLLSLFHLLTPTFAIFAACWLLLVGAHRSWRDERLLALGLLLLPLMQSLTLWALGLYPLSGSRHNYPLAVLLLPIIASGLLAVFQRPWWCVVPLMVLVGLGTFWNWVGALTHNGLLPGQVMEQRIRTQTILDSPVWSKIREGGTLILDHQSFYPLLPALLSPTPWPQGRPRSAMAHHPVWQGPGPREPTVRATRRTTAHPRAGPLAGTTRDDRQGRSRTQDLRHATGLPCPCGLARLRVRDSAGQQEARAGPRHLARAASDRPLCLAVTGGGTLPDLHACHRSAAREAQGHTCQGPLREPDPGMPSVPKSVSRWAERKNALEDRLRLDHAPPWPRTLHRACRWSDPDVPIRLAPSA